VCFELPAQVVLGVEEGDDSCHQCPARFITRILARTTSVLPAAATSRLVASPIQPRHMKVTGDNIGALGTTVVDRQWAEAHGLAYGPSNVVAKDISGSSIETFVAQDVRLRSSSIETPPVDLVIIDMPEILRFVGVSVIWSPQTTVPQDKMIRLDFANGAMELRDDSELAADPEELCIGEKFGYAALLTSATVGGHAARLELDSGASETSLSASSDAGARLARDVTRASTTSQGGGRCALVDETRPAGDWRGTVRAPTQP